MAIDTSSTHYNQVINFLSSYLFELSLTRMSKHCSSEFTFSNTDFVNHETCEVLGEDSSMSLLWGEAGAIVFKVHYDHDVIKPYAAVSLMKNIDDLPRETIRAYMNEYLNLFSGYFRGITEEKGLNFGTSLPFHTRGKDETIFFTLRDKRFKYYKWKIVDQNGNFFYCTCELYPIDNQLFLRLQKDMLIDLEADKSNEQDGEIQFF
jgi:hypothetical protein